MVQGDTRRRRAFVGLSMLVMVGLAGCTQGEPPEEPTPVVVQPSPTVSTPSPSPTGLVEPEKPAEWTETTDSAAIAAAQYFMALSEYSTATGDLGEWDRLSGDLCGFCTNFRDGVESIYSVGDHLTGGDVDSSDYELVDVDEQLVTFVVQLRYAAAPSTRVFGDGSPPVEYKAQSGWLLLNVGPGRGGWVLFGGEHIESPL